MTHLELINAANARIMKSDALSYYEEILLDPALYREEYEQSKQYLHWLIEASEQDLLAYAKAEREWEERRDWDKFDGSDFEDNWEDDCDDREYRESEECWDWYSLAEYAEYHDDSEDVEEYEEWD